MRREQAKSEQANLVRAVEKGAGDLEVLVAALRARDAEIKELDDKIETAQVAMKPLLFPKALSVAEVREGNASLFTNQLAHGRRVIEEAITAVLVRNDGNVIAKFRESSLFEPIRYYTVKLEHDAVVLMTRSR